MNPTTLTGRTLGWGPLTRLAIGAATALVLGLGPTLPPAGVAAHGADPSIGGSLWYQGQSLPYTWASGQVPPAWLQGAFNGSATASNTSRASRAPQLYQASSGSTVAYGEPTGCSPAGIACFWRNAPSSFRIWFRANGYWFDWGQLRWCQVAGWSSGCYDAQNVGLDEVGHVLGLDHHVNWSDSSDYSDAVVQAVTRSYPRTGSTAHTYGRCDQARLQLQYEPETTWASVSTCLALPTETGLGASATSVTAGGSVLFSASLRIAPSAAAGAMTGDGLSGRTLVLERRFPGGSTWTPVATMAPQSAAGSYAVTTTVTGTYEWRARFSNQAGEGLLASSSGGIVVYVKSCSICPNAVSVGSAADR